MLRIKKMEGAGFWQSIAVKCFKSLVTLSLLTALNKVNGKHQQKLTTTHFVYYCFLQDFVRHNSFLSF